MTLGHILAMVEALVKYISGSEEKKRLLDVLGCRCIYAGQFVIKNFIFLLFWQLIAQELNELQNKHRNTVARVEEAKRKHLNLGHRLLKVRNAQSTNSPNEKFENILTVLLYCQEFLCSYHVGGSPFINLGFMGVESCSTSFLGFFSEFFHPTSHCFSKVMPWGRGVGNLVWYSYQWLLCRWWPIV